MKLGSPETCKPLIDRPDGLVLGARCILNCDWSPASVDVERENRITEYAWLRVLTSGCLPRALPDDIAERIEIRVAALLEIRAAVTHECWWAAIAKLAVRP